MLTLVAFLAALTVDAPRTHGQPPVEHAGRCYQVTGEAVFVMHTYNHVVTVTNSCSKSVHCKVWTSVDPEPKVSLKVTKGSSQSVTTRRGSPASSFTAYGECNASD